MYCSISYHSQGIEATEADEWIKKIKKVSYVYVCVCVCVCVCVYVSEHVSR